MNIILLRYCSQTTVHTKTDIAYMIIDLRLYQTISTVALKAGYFSVVAVQFSHKAHRRYANAVLR